MQEQVLTIDFGSSYTKLAWRTGFNGVATLLRRLPGASKDFDYCVPSSVARITRRGTVTWQTGSDAADLVPADGIEVFRNWKAWLFEDARQGAGPQPEDRESLVEEIAHQYFRGLRGQLTSSTRTREAASLPLRICVPSLKERPQAIATLQAAAVEAGWRLAPDAERPIIAEPEANALGVVTRGKNATWLPKPMSFQPYRGRSAHLPSMLEPNIAAAFKQMKREYRLLVVDVGAYTTDFGLITFDSSFWTEDWNRPQVRHASVALGIRDLDQAVRGCLSAESREAVDRLSFAQWDLVKASLYAGSPQKLRSTGNRVIEVGGDSERDAIGDQIIRFTDRVWRARQQFLGDALTIDAEVLTGGGSLVRLTREVLLERMRGGGRAVVHDLMSVHSSGTGTRHGGRRSASTQDELDESVRIGRDLIRGASAIGGCSVFF